MTIRTRPRMVIPGTRSPSGQCPPATTPAFYRLPMRAQSDRHGPTEMIRQRGQAEDEFRTAFALTLATALPPDPDLFVVATLSVKRFPEAGPVDAQLDNVKIVALTVDNLSVTSS